MIRFLRLLAVNLLVLAALVVIVEGAASVFLFLYSAEFQPVTAEHSHTAYDPDLGWANRPGLRLPDFYRPGASLTTNRRGFRGSAEVEEAKPAGKRRVICSGDSFTLGYGVDDAETWCQQLARHDAAIEPVNMGQGGYGFDQAYLWYRRDGAPLEHDVHVFAFITDDFRRMTLSSYTGYAKPWLAVEQGRLVTKNTPVPKGTYTGAWAWFARNASVMHGLRTTQLLSKIGERLGLGTGGAIPRELWPAGQRAVVRAILEDLADRHRKAGRRFVAAHLPASDELAGSGHGLEWMAFFAAESVRLGFEFVDLRPELARLAPAERPALYIQPGDMRFYGAAGHYTALGNAEVAKVLARRLAEPPVKAARQ